MTAKIQEVAMKTIIFETAAKSYFTGIESPSFIAIMK